MAQLAVAVALALSIAACNLAPPTPTGPIPSGGALGGQLCDTQNPASLRSAVAQLNTLTPTDDPAPLLVSLGATLAVMQQLQLDPSNDLVSWRDASIDAVQQLQQRISDPTRRDALVLHASRTLGLFADRLCGPTAS